MNKYLQGVEKLKHSTVFSIAVVFMSRIIMLMMSTFNKVIVFSIAGLHVKNNNFNYEYF